MNRTRGIISQVTYIMGLLLFVWLGASALMIIGSCLALLHFSPKSTPSVKSELPPVSILKPLCGIDEGLAENLRGLFSLNYPEYEIIFSVADPADPALDLVKSLIEAHPETRAHLIVDESRNAGNPKINNLIFAYSLARFDWVMISDSNVRMQGDELRNIAQELTPTLGGVYAIVRGVTKRSPDLGALLEQAHLGTFLVRWTVLAEAVGWPCVLGKSILIRKHTIEAIGGLPALAGYIAEDYKIGELAKKQGQRIGLSRHTVQQSIGRYAIRQYVGRHVRWGRIRRSLVPVAFFGESLTNALLPGVCGAVALQHFLSFDPVFFFGLHSAVWALGDLVLIARVTRGPTLFTLLVWPLKEALSVAMWITSYFSRTIYWRNRPLRLRRGGLLDLTRNVRPFIRTPEASELRG